MVPYNFECLEILKKWKRKRGEKEKDTLALYIANCL